MKNKMN